MLKDKVILVTGASKGIGAETARILASCGATVAVNYYKDAEGAGRVVKEISKAGRGRAFSFRADVSKESEVKKIIKDIIGRFKKIDIVINNASAPLGYKIFEEYGWMDFQKQLDVNLKGAFNVIKGALPQMLKRNSGKIINILSSVTIGVPPAKPIDYISSKYALLGFSKALAVEVGPFGITVNCVSPGMTDTEMTKDMPAKLKEIVALQTPLKRLAKPSDVAGVLVFLCSDKSDYLTGCNIPVCGGSVML